MSTVKELQENRGLSQNLVDFMWKSSGGKARWCYRTIHGARLFDEPPRVSWFGRLLAILRRRVSV